MEVRNKIPLVYHPEYNISFYGLESVLHSFDSKKYGRIFDALATSFSISEQGFHQPQEVDTQDLLQIHTQAHLRSLRWSANAAMIAEVPLLAAIPNCIVDQKLLRPMRLATGGTILAVKLAVEHGWAINLAGGYHHAKPDKGGGFCFYADIALAIHALHKTHPQLRVLIVDLDAHQGNGLISSFAQRKADGSLVIPISYQADDRIRIMDMYNVDNYPGDRMARQFISCDVPIRHGTADAQYLPLLRRHLAESLQSFHPDLVIYNAGTDIYEEDPLGGLSISQGGIIQRDEIVFHACRQAGVSIAMVLSGGYSMHSAGIITESLTNLHHQGLISLTRPATAADPVQNMEMGR